MSAEFVTIAKNHKDFKNYMLGKVPGNENLISVPVKAFNTDLDKDQMTFQLIDKNKVNSPKFSVLSTQLMRLKWLTLTLTPVICAFAYLENLGFNFNLFNMALVCITILFAHASIFILNDFYDHLFGIDSLRPKGGTRVIQKAWLEASSVRTLGFVFLALAASIGLYLSYIYDWKLLILGGIGVSIGWAYSYFSKYKSFIGLNAFIINMFMGPFLVLGFSMGIAKYYNTSLLVMGLLFGLMAYLCIGFRHIENLYLSNKKMGTSIVEYLGFDKARVFLLCLLFMVPVIYIYLCFSISFQGFVTKTILLFVPIMSYLLIVKTTYQLKSSMGSTIVSLRNLAAMLHIITGLALTAFFLIK